MATPRRPTIAAVTRAPPAVPETDGKKPLHCLFLCTGNSARSILAEATLNALGGDRFRGLSAGSRPTGEVNPFALRQLESAGIPADGLRSKSWDAFVGGDDIDIVITVCDSAAGESCPALPGRPPTAHWGIPDPAAATDDAAPAAFAAAWELLRDRIAAMVAEPLEDCGPDERRRRLEAIAARYPA